MPKREPPHQVRPPRFKLGGRVSRSRMARRSPGQDVPFMGHEARARTRRDRSGCSCRQAVQGLAKAVSRRRDRDLASKRGSSKPRGRLTKRHPHHVRHPRGLRRANRRADRRLADRPNHASLADPLSRCASSRSPANAHADSVDTDSPRARRSNCSAKLFRSSSTRGPPRDREEAACFLMSWMRQGTPSITRTGGLLRDRAECARRGKWKIAPRAK